MGRLGAGPVSETVGIEPHGVRGLLGPVVDLDDGLVDLFAGGGLFLAGRGNGPHLVGCGEGVVDDFAQGLAGFVGKCRGCFNLLKRVVHVEVVWPEDGAAASPLYLLAQKTEKQRLAPVLDFFANDFGDIDSAAWFIPMRRAKLSLLSARKIG